MTTAGIPAHQKRRSIVPGKFAKAFKERYGNEAKGGEPEKPKVEPKAPPRRAK
jgi:hypothetical protein